MMNLLKALRQDEHGVILSTEIVIIGSLLVIGLITGLTCLQKSVNGELQDLAGAIGALDQTYSFSAHRKSGYAGQCCAYTAGSSFTNCELRDPQCGDILGCTDACQVHTQPCGNCNSCNSAVVVSEGQTGCGVCGGHGGGCSACGGGVRSSTGRVSTIQTDVPKMKVTEWPGFNQSPQVPRIDYPAGEMVIESSQHEVFQSTEEIVEQPPTVIEHPMIPETDAPPVQSNPSLVPIPEIQPLPGLPMPPSA